MTQALGLNLDQPGVQRLVLASDQHLCAELPRTRKRFCAWLQAVSQRCEAVLLLGDLFDVWVGDDWLDDAPPWLHEVVDALRLASQCTRLYVMRGNRDFMLGERFAEQTGVTLLPDEVVLEHGTMRIVLCHGDTLVTDDAAYQQWRALTRQAAWQADFLARPLAERLQLAQQYRNASRNHQRVEPPHDVHCAACAALLQRHAASWLIHGHTHRPREHWGFATRAAAATGSHTTPTLRQVLSDWMLDKHLNPETAASPEVPRGDALWLAMDNQRVSVWREAVTDA